MNIVLYALMTYGLAAVISFAVVAIIVVIGKVMSRPDKNEEESTDA